MSASRNSTHRIVLALLLALGASTATAADLIDTIVVRFRDVAVSPSSSSLPASFAQSLRAQLGQGFTVSGRTRDGAWQLTLDGGIDVAALRGALNAVRLDPAIAYANAAIATQVSGAGGPPTDRI